MDVGAFQKKILANDFNSRACRCFGELFKLFNMGVVCSRHSRKEQSQIRTMHIILQSQ